MTGDAELPAGCAVHHELEAKQLLERLFRVGGADEVERVYRELHDERGERPSAGELQRMGYLPSRIRERHGSWFAFVATEDDLSPEEASVLYAANAFLREVETTEMTKCFKMITLEALLESQSILSGLEVRELAHRSHTILRRSPELFADVAEDMRIEELDASNEAKWIAYWRKNPIAAWTGAKPNRRQWFALASDRLHLDLELDPSLEPTLIHMTRELVDYRLAQYRAR